MDATDALRLIVARSPRAAENALRTMAAARNNSPVLQTRYIICLQMALADPDAEFTAAERQLLADGIPDSDSDTRGYTLRIRLTDGERECLTREATEAGQTMSEYARRRLFG